ncbi:MAG TPA: DUF1326 domain-containing protein [Chloroflexota bacterium]|nr:DUF1326 domain-containing protein [Chloroflexota bacterium]
MVPTQNRWRITGDYFENCNCDVVCPCLASVNAPMTARPTQGACEVAFAFHIEAGSYGDLSLDGLNAALIARTPGAMAAGDWTVALYVDERGDTDQRDALQAIFSGSAGGIMGHFSPLISTVLGVKAVPISFQKEGRRRGVEIPGLMHMGVQAVPNVAPDPIMAANLHPFNLEGVALAVCEDGSTWADYGMHWDNSGKNGHYAPISWSNA